MREQAGSGGELVDDKDGIFPTTSYEATAPPTRPFEPWHKPRKQVVRSHQWLQQTAQLLDEIPSDSSVKYLGLPGADLLDLRALHTVVCPEREFLFLGFTTSQSDDSRVLLEISLQEVKALGNVEDRSRVMTDDIRSLGRPNSLGNKAAADLGPFDIVNLDFCDNVLGGATGDMSVYNAIMGLFGLQNRRMQPWLLFITTRVDRTTMNVEVQERLDALLARNHAECDPFATAMRELQADPATTPALGTCTDDEWLDLCCVALSKWILSLAASQRTALEVKSTMSYCVNAGQDTDDLVSVAYRLTPSLSAGEDPAGLADSLPPQPDECLLASQLPARAKRRASIDHQLARDRTLMKQMTEETVDLLTQARYDPAEYRAWLAAAGA